MDLGLRGKVALVGGASQGLGAAIADALAAEGASVILCARTKGALEAVARDLANRHGVRTLPRPTDISDPEQVHGLVADALAEFGRIDVLVTNGGGPPSGSFESIGASAWENAYALLLRSAVELIRAVLPGMKERRYGRIVNVTSIAAKQPVGDLILSNALRAGVLGMARTLANETAPFGITVNNVLPGYTRTERVEKLAAAAAERTNSSRESVTSRWTSEIPAGRLGEPRELAALVAFLASEPASYVTGQSIAADGGWIRGLL